VKPPFSCEKREQHPRTLSRKRTTKVVRSAGLRRSIERPVLFNRKRPTVPKIAAMCASLIRLLVPEATWRRAAPRLAEEEEIENL